jgi:hypothetical protein
MMSFARAALMAPAIVAKLQLTGHTVTDEGQQTIPRID